MKRTPRTMRRAGCSQIDSERETEILVVLAKTGSISETCRQCKAGHSTVVRLARERAEDLQEVREAAVKILPSVVAECLAKLITRLVEKSEQADFGALTVAVVRLAELPGKLREAAAQGQGIQEGLGFQGSPGVVALFDRLLEEQIKRSVEQAIRDGLEVEEGEGPRLLEAGSSEVPG